MPTADPHNISIADLTAAGLRLRPVEAVTIARELTLRAHHGELPGIPSSSVLRFTSDGDTVCEGPVAAGQSVDRAGRLLESLLPGFDAAPEFRVPGALRLIVARALGTLDLPAYRTLDEFAEAMDRFCADDMTTVVRGLVRTWRGAVEVAPAAAVEPAAAVAASAVAGAESLALTISDVRRARRATGLRLGDIAERSRIPVSLLRELEWGYFVNWPANGYGRSLLVRYARAAGLDVEVVTGAVLPVLEEAVRDRTTPAVLVDGSIVDLVDGSIMDDEADHLAETRLARVPPALPPVPRDDKRERRPLWLAALAIPALLAVGLVPAAWQSRNQGVSGEAASQAPAARSAGATSETAPAPEESRNTSTSITPSGPGSSGVPLAAAPPVSTTSVAAPDVRPGSGAQAAAQIAETSRAGTRPADGDAAPAVPGRADLTGDDEVAYSPTFASAGSAMFYHADAGDSSAIMRADTGPTGAVLRVTSIVNDDAKNFHARPSPDGSRIAFDSDRQGGRAVYVADSKGQNVQRVSGEGFAAVPSWSPDGRTLAFVRAEPGRPRVWNIWTRDLESGETTRLTSHRVGQPWGAAWFPDGRRIAYSHEERLIIRSLDSGEEQIFRTPRKGHLVRTPAVSPDGRLVMFQVHRDGAWMLDVNKGGMRKVLADPTAEEFTWSPDGRRVAYHSRKAGGWGVWMMGAR